MSYSILIIEDDAPILDFLKSIVLEQGYKVHTANTGIEGLRLIENHHIDLVLLDLQLPDMQGESICKKIKEDFPESKVILLTAKNSIEEKVGGFAIGADDYITKPFAAEELIARIKARLRNPETEGSTLSIADLELNSKKIEVKRAGKIIPLAAKEFKLLEYLMLNKGVVVTREMILNRVWAYTFEVESRVVDVYIGYLRDKIDKPFKKKLIKTVRGFGYTLKE